MSEPREIPSRNASDVANAIVLLTDPIDEDATGLLRSVASIVNLGDPGYEQIGEAVSKADVVIVRRSIPADALPDATRLRALIRNGVGLDFIPVDAASELGIAVVNTPGVNATSVGEAAIGMLLAGFRRIALKDRMIRGGEWASLRSSSFEESDVSGKRLGLIGLGAVAQEIARMAHFGFNIQVSAARKSPREAAPYISHVTLDELLRESDIIVIACPLTDETRGMIDASRINLMKPGAAVINIARGPIVDERALVAALCAGRLSFAALDVFCEQPLPLDNPLLGLDNVVLTPHTAGITKHAMRRMSTVSAEEALRVLRGERPLNLVNPNAWDRIADRWDEMSDLRQMLP